MHETEALRPSDPIPKSMQTPLNAVAGAAGCSNSGTNTKQSLASGATRLKIIIKPPHAQTTRNGDAVETNRTDDDDGNNDNDDNDDHSAVSFRLAPEHGFTDEELAMPLPRLFRLCRRQLLHAETEGADLERQCGYWEAAYAQLWCEKEALLAQVIHSEVSWHQRKQAILDGTIDVRLRTVAATASGEQDVDIKPSIEILE